MKVSCLCLTCNRFERLREALSCFLLQDYKNKELIILNDSPVPINIGNIPNVSVLNIEYKSFLNSRLSLLESASGDLICWWDDDDIYLPWHITQRVENIKDHLVWKPREFWFSEKLIGNCNDAKVKLDGNRVESSWIVRKEVISISEYEKLGESTVTWPFSLDEFLYESSVGCLTSYVYRWDIGEAHLSGFPSDVPEKHRRIGWLKMCEDTGKEHELKPKDMLVYFDAIKRLTSTFDLSGILVKKFNEVLCHTPPQS